VIKQLFVLASGALLAGQALAGPNLISNGDFEAGNTGFSSDYGYVVDQGYYALWGEGTYTVGENADQYHGLWADVSNHTAGGSKYMIINGAPDTGKTVWQSNALSLGAGTYSFSAYVTDICCNSFFNGWNALPVLTFTATTDTHIPMSFVLGSQAVQVDAPGTWYQLTTTFTLDGAASGFVSLSNSEGALSGNDFGLDDISLIRQTGNTSVVGGVPEPASWAMMVGGFGLVGGALRRRQRPAARFA
jgi:hypothetical protein